MGKKGAQTSSSSTVPEYISKGGEDLYNRAMGYVFGNSGAGSNNASGGANMQNSGGMSNTYGQTATGAGAPSTTNNGSTGSYFSNMFSGQPAQANIFQPQNGGQDNSSGTNGGTQTPGIFGNTFQSSVPSSIKGGASSKDYQLDQGIAPTNYNQDDAYNTAKTVNDSAFFGNNYYQPARGYVNRAADMNFTERYDPNAVGGRDVSTGQWGQSAADQYMNPFVQSALDPSLQRMNEQNALKIAQNRASAGRVGAFGGARTGVQDALTNSENSRNMQEAQYKGLQDAYTNAQNIFGQDQNRALTAQQSNQAKDVNLGQFNETQRMNSVKTNADVNNMNRTQLLNAAQTLGGLGTQQSNVINDNINRLLTTGAAQQQTQQNALNNEYSRYQTNRQQPLNDIAAIASILYGSPEKIQTTSQPNTAAQIGGGLMGLAGSALSDGGGAALFKALSDSRLKEDIIPMGEKNGYPVYQFRYKGDDRKWIGVMAQEVKKITPEAVRKLGKYYIVDYGKLGFAMESADV